MKTMKSNSMERPGRFWRSRAATGLLSLAVWHGAGAGTEAALWDNNDYVVSNLTGLVVLDENFNVKAVIHNTDIVSAAGQGLLDWCSNGDVMVGTAQISFALHGLRYNHEGRQVRVYSGSSSDLSTPGDMKASVNDEFIGGSYLDTGVVRYGLPSSPVPPHASFNLLQTFNFSTSGGLAVVTRNSGARELWMGADLDFLGIQMYPIAADGLIRFDQGQPINPSTSGFSHTMRFDPVGKRVLLYDEDQLSPNYRKVVAMDVETRQVAQTYTIPPGQHPGTLWHTGLEAGADGKIIAVESFYLFERDFSPTRRVGLSVWDADGSNYRFIDFKTLAGYPTIVEPDGRGGFRLLHAPYQILWTGNSPEFNQPNTAPEIACPDALVESCVGPAGVSADFTATVTDPDAGQSLTVRLKRGDTVLGEQVVATPVADAPVTFAGIVLGVGQHDLMIEVSDGEATASCATSVTLNPYAAPTVSFSPVDQSAECPASASFGTPLFYSACDAGLSVVANDETLPVSGREVSKTRRTWTATDDLGQSVSTSQTVTVLDNGAPVFAGTPPNLTALAASASGAIVNFPTPTANDACSGPAAVVCSPASGSLFPVGQTTVICTATDASGLTATVTFTVNVAPLQVSWSGVLQPVNANGTSVFKLGRVVPVKFKLTGAHAGRTDLVAKLAYTQLSSGLPGAVNEADGPGNSTAGNQFVYDPATKEYQFNWSTLGLGAGTYRLFIDLGDGAPKMVNVGLR